MWDVVVIIVTHCAAATMGFIIGVVLGAAK